MGTKKNRNSKDLTEAEEIKNRWQEYTEEEVARIHRRIIQKDLNDPDKYDGVVPHLEPDILKCDV